MPAKGGTSIVVDSHGFPRRDASAAAGQTGKLFLVSIPNALTGANLELPYPCGILFLFSSHVAAVLLRLVRVHHTGIFRMGGISQHCACTT